MRSLENLVWALCHPPYSLLTSVDRLLVKNLRASRIAPIDAYSSLMK